MRPNLLVAEQTQQNWQQQMAEAFTSIADLCQYLQLTAEELPISQAASQQFPLRVPLSFATRMTKGDPNDPLLRQVLPVADELIAFPGFTTDPVGDLNAAKQPGLLHKYHGRVLLINTGACAINCRYCFRRNFPYGEMQLTKQQESKAIAYICSDASITEVILSGGDPLLLSDERLSNLFKQLADIEHVKRIRIHSRLPIVLPARMTQRLGAVLAQRGKPVVLVIHANHPQELNEDVHIAIAPLKSHGLTLLNQAVLLAGVNDDADTLCRLSERLFEIGILPYYLHLLDKASGTGHFEVTEDKARQLHRQMQQRLPGYLVPKLVKEVAGAETKQAIELSVSLETFEQVDSTHGSTGSPRTESTTYRSS